MAKISGTAQHYQLTSGSGNIQFTYSVLEEVWSLNGFIFRVVALLFA